MHQRSLRHLFFAIAVLFWVGQSFGQATFSLQADGYDSHAELTWEKPDGVSPDFYIVHRSTNGVDFLPLKNTNQTSELDFTGFDPAAPHTYYYYVAAMNGVQAVLAKSDTVQATIAELGDNALLDMVQKYTFRYFWDFGHPVSGMARERDSSGDIVTTGGTGFGVMALLVGIERGFITRQQGRDRLLKIVSFLQFADRFHGVFPHWMNGVNGNVIPFSQYDDGGDLVETAFLMQGLLAARQYFDEDEPNEDALRQAITGLWEDVEWDFYRKNNSGVLYWHWSPNFGWQMNFQLRGFNEAMIVYILAIASPTHPVPASLWNTGWTAQNYASGLSWFGYPLAVGPPLGGPLFFAHYSYLGFDPRNKKDAFPNYFIRNTNHTLINRAYCIANPLNYPHYSEVCWGLTASDDPFGYSAHEALASRDNGTITPTAALSSMPYTPAESMAALKHFYREHGEDLWGNMGFYDAFNLKQNWFATSYLAIDQGPIIGMIENHRTALLWDMFMANPEIQPALDAIGFVPDISSAEEGFGTNTGLSLSPNPAGESLELRLVLTQKEQVTIAISDLQGKLRMEVATGRFFPEGESAITIDTKDLSPGLYIISVKTDSTARVGKFVKN